MKSYIILSSLILTLIGAGAYYNLTFDESRSYTFVGDLTGEVPLLPTIQDIQHISQVETKPWSTLQIRIVAVSDLEILSSVDFILEPRFPWTANPAEREQEIKEFLEDIQRALRVLKSSAHETQKSSIYLHLNRELDHLSHLDYSIRELHSYSDLYENTEIHSVYTNRKVDMAKVESEVYAQALKNIASPSKPGDIDIVFHYKPSNRLDSKLFRQAVLTYELLYPEAHVSIHSKMPSQ